MAGAMSDNLTPMMQQYQKIRASLPPQTLLFYRLGDFYEMFFEDAREAASILNVALTKRHTTPMCGVPYHSAEGYIAKLIKAGKRIAICEQTSDAQPGKIVQREVTQIISPGTVSDFNLLDSAKNNYLAAVFHDAGRYGLAVMDLSTGEFRLTQMESMSVLLDELARINPAEMLVAEAQAQMEHFSDLTNTVSVEDFLFSQEHSSFTLLDHFKTQSLDGFGVAHLPFGTAAAGAILHYLRHSLRRNVVVESAYFGQMPYMLLQSDLVLTTGRQFLRFYQLWHDRVHQASEHKWLRDLIGTVARDLQARAA